MVLGILMISIDILIPCVNFLFKMDWLFFLFVLLFFLTFFWHFIELISKVVDLVKHLIFIVLLLFLCDSVILMVWVEKLLLIPLEQILILIIIFIFVEFHPYPCLLNYAEKLFVNRLWLRVNRPIFS